MRKVDPEIHEEMYKVYWIKPINGDPSQIRFKQYVSVWDSTMTKEN